MASTRIVRRVEPRPYPSLLAAATRWGQGVLAAVALIVLALPMALIALAVWRSSSGPLCERHDGELRFRTHLDGARTAAHRRYGQMLGAVACDDHPVTPVGRVLERTGLDRLPGLLDVVRGR